MATYNKSTKGSMKTFNKSGHAAYKTDDKTRLVTMALTTMLGEQKFYGDNTNDLIDLAIWLCRKGEGEFVAKLAVWARTKGNLRSVSHALIAVCAHECSGQAAPGEKSFVRKAAGRIASMRGDDGAEMIATYWALFGKKAKHPHALQRGIRDALEVARPYAIAKYQGNNRDVKMRDVLRLTHPNAILDGTTEAMGKAIDGTLAMPKSWETELSARGNTAEVWNELIAENKVGYMALLRNLRNIVKSGADMEPVLERLQDREAVLNSRQLPFRFYSAYATLSLDGFASTSIMRAIDRALTISCMNVEHLPGKTAVLIDVSGSMSSRVSGKSIVSCADVAGILGAMASHISDDALVIAFNNRAEVIPMTGLTVLADKKMLPMPGGGTDMAAGFEKLMMTGFDADRVIVLSDNEVNGGGWWSRDNKKVIQHNLDEYRKRVGHDVWCHAIDMQGYGTQQFIGEHVNIIAGWSEQVLRFVSLAEQGFGGIVNEIDAMTL